MCTVSQLVTRDIRKCGQRRSYPEEKDLAVDIVFSSAEIYCSCWNIATEVGIYLFLHTHTHTHIYIYIYIYMLKKDVFIAVFS